MKIKNTLTKILNSSWIALTSLQFSLLPNFAYAQNQAPAGQQVIGVMQQMQGMIMNDSQQRQDILMAQGINVSNQIQASTDLVFGCAVLPTTSTKPALKLCQFTPGNPNAYTSDGNKMGQFSRIASDNVHLYDLHLDEAQNDSAIGLKCLDRRKEEMERQLSNIEKQFEAMMATFKEEDARFKAAYDEELGKLVDSKSILDGPQSGGLIDGNTIDYSQFFADSSCGSMINVSDLTTSQGGLPGGLRGVFNDKKDLNEKALEVANYDFTNILQTKTAQLRNNFSTYGIGDILNGDLNAATIGTEGTTTPKSMEDAFAKVKKDFGAKFGIVNQDISNYGSIFGVKDVTPNSKYASNIDKIIAAAESSDVNGWENKFLNQCITGNVGEGQESFFSGESLDVMIERVRQPNVKSKSNVASFQSFLDGLKKANMPVGQKQSELKEYLAKYSSSQYPLVILDRNGGYIAPETYFDREVASCRAQMKSNQVFTDPQTNNKITYEEARNNAVNALKEAKRLHGNFVNEAVNAIQNKFISCEGIQYNGKSGNGPGGCGMERLDINSSQFCAGHSMSCSNNVQQCYGQLKNTIKATEQQMKDSAVAISNLQNGKRRQLTTRLQQLARVAQQMNLNMANRFSFVDPLDLNMPDLVIPQVANTLNPEQILANGGSMEDILNQFQSLLDNNIKGALAKQRAEIIAKIDEEKGKRKQAYSEEKAYWAGVQKECTKAKSEYANAINQFNQSENERYQKQIQAFGNLCRNAQVANSINCNQDSINKVDDAMNQLGQALNPADYAGYSQFKQSCAQVNDQAEVREDVKDENYDRAFAFCSSISTGHEDDLLKSVNPARLKSLDPALEAEVQKWISQDLSESLANMNKYSSKYPNNPLLKYYVNMIKEIKDQKGLINKQCENAIAFGNGGKKKCSGTGDNKECEEPPGLSVVSTVLGIKKAIRDANDATGFGEIHIPSCVGINQQGTDPFSIQDPYEILQRGPAGGFQTLR